MTPQIYSYIKRNYIRKISKFRNFPRGNESSHERISLCAIKIINEMACSFAKHVTPFL